MREEIPSGKRLPGYPVPIMLLARLAVDEQFQGDRLGETTLISALQKSVELTEAGLPALGVIVDVLNEDALSFYQHYDLFESFTDDPMRLFVSMHVLKKILSAAFLPGFHVPQNVCSTTSSGSGGNI